MDKKRIIECERNFPNGFANVEDKSFGRLFYHQDNPFSHDSNHAIILNFEQDLESVVQEIEMFYSQMGIIPRVYGAHLPEEKEILFPILRKAKFEVREWEDTVYLVHDHPSEIQPNAQLQIKRLQVVDPEIMEIFRSEDGDEGWTYKVLQEHIKSPDFHLLAGSVNGTLVTVVSLKIMDGYSRVDDMFTHALYRGKGYGRTLIHYLIDYHKSISSNVLYLYVHNPIAYRMYIEAGFMDKGIQLASWSAWKE